MKKRVVMFAISLLVGCWGRSLGAGLEEKTKTKMKPVLLVIDVQKAFLPYMSDQDKKTAMEWINAAIFEFRTRHLPIIRVYHADKSWGPKPDTPEFEFAQDIFVKPEDAKIVKNYPSAFQKTDLDKLLRDQGCDTVFLCGLSATGCVLATYYGALERDYDPFMIQGGLMSNDANHTRMVETICNAVGYKALQKMLDQL